MKSEPPEDYTQEILRILEGEAYGETLFTALADRETDPVNAKLWSLASELERLTFARICPLAERLGGDISLISTAGRTRGREQAKKFAALSSAEIAHYFQNRVGNSLRYFTELEKRAPKTDKAILQQITGHSRAFGEFIRCWLTNKPEAAAESLSDFINVS